MKRLVSRRNRPSLASRLKKFNRVARFEQLEEREVLAAPTLAAISNFDIYEGAPLPIALQGADADGDTITYTVTSTAPNSLKVLTTAESNRSLKITMKGFGNDANTVDGTMTFQLFEDRAPLTTAKIIGLANQGIYTQSTFHRIIKDFMIQGGKPSGGATVSNIDDEFSADLQFTRDGILAMANAGDDTGNSQFFITAEPTRWLDYEHTIFGFLTDGDDVRQRIASVPANQQSGAVTGDEPVIKAMSVVADKQRDVVLLNLESLPSGTSPITVTVTATDSHGESTHQSFTVTPHADTVNDHPYLTSPTTPVTAYQNTPMTFQIKGWDVENTAIQYSAALSTANSNIDVSANRDTGVVTVTPKNNVTGVFTLVLKAGDGTTDDTQQVPLYIAPATPTGITLLNPSTGTDTTTANNTAGRLLQFRVSGTVSGAVVVLSANGQEIARGTATASTLDLASNGTSTLAVGSYAVTAVQMLANQTVNVGNIKTTTNLTSMPSASMALKVAAVTGNSAPGVYDPSTSHFHFRNTNTSGVQDSMAAYGMVNTAHPWLPVIGDWNGDGVETIGLYDPTAAVFYLRNANTTGYADLIIGFGTPGNNWTPIAGDWNGDGVDGVGLFDSTTSMFYLRNTRTTGISEVAFVFGTPKANATPVVGDWNGDKTDSIGLYTQANEHFALRNTNTGGAADLDFNFSTSSSSGANTVPVVGDWYASGTDTVGVYNTTSNQLRFKQANKADAAIASLYFGYASPKLTPVVGAWGNTSAASVSERSLADDLLDTLAANALQSDT